MLKDEIMHTLIPRFLNECNIVSVVYVSVVYVSVVYVSVVYVNVPC